MSANQRTICEHVKIKPGTRKAGGAVDTHGARDQCMSVFVYVTDHKTEPAAVRAPMRFTEVYLALVTIADFRRNRYANCAKTGFTEMPLSLDRARGEAGDVVLDKERIDDRDRH